MRPTSPHRSVLTPAEEAMVVEFGRRTLLPLGDVLGAYLPRAHVALTSVVSYLCLGSGTGE